MASSVIGALRVNLGLDSAQFSSGLRGAKSSLQKYGQQFAAIAAASAAAFGAVSAAALAGARDIDKAAKSARRLDSSIGGFRGIELAADEAGVSLSGLTNDIQTMNREIANIGISGNADRALETLKLELSDLAGLDADEKLAVIADQIKALGLDSGQTTAVLRDLGVRNREMVLLLGAGGDVIRKARSDIEDYGLAISQVDSDRIEVANDAIGRLGLITQYAGQQLAIALVPAFGRLAEAMTDSLREGGLLRIVLDGLIDNMQRLGTYIAVAVTGFGVRYVGALVLAKIATFSLAGALTALRVAIIRTGIGALIVGAGELVYQFSRLVTATGGVGNALGLLKDVALEVYDRMKRGVALVGEAFGVAGFAMRAAFMGAFADIAGGFASLTQGIADGFNNLFGTELQGLGTEFAAQMESSAANMTASAAELSQSLAGSFRDLGAPLKSIQAIRDAMADSKDEADGTADAVARLNEGIESLDDGAGGGGGKGTSGLDKTKDKLEQVRTAAESASSSFKEMAKSIITGSDSAASAISKLAASLADQLLDSALTPVSNLFGSLFSGLFGGGPSIPAYANGTNYHPGGMALVGERGPELVNLPRGSQVTPNGQFGDGGGSMDVRVLIDENGNLDARIERVSGRVSARVVQTGISQYDRDILPASMQRVSADPRRRG